MSAGEAVNPPRERWFLRLYPREWRARYGDELSALVGDRPLSLGREPQTIADGFRGAGVMIVATKI